MSSYVAPKQTDTIGPVRRLARFLKAEVWAATRLYFRPILVLRDYVGNEAARFKVQRSATTDSGEHDLETKNQQERVLLIANKRAFMLAAVESTIRDIKRTISALQESIDFDPRALRILEVFSLRLGLAVREITNEIDPESRDSIDFAKGILDEFEKVRSMLESHGMVKDERTEWEPHAQ